MKGNAIKSIMEYEDLGVFMLTGDEISNDPQKVNLCTTSGVKGLEFSVVLIANFNKIGTQKQMYADVTEVHKHLKKMDKNVYAAIAMALFEHQGNNVHDKEPGIITIKPKQTLWNAKFLSFTAKP